MTGKKKGSVIGFDPLAWMKEQSPESGVRSPESTKDSLESGVGSLESKAKTTLGVGVPTPDSRLQAPDSAVALGDSLTIEQAAAMHAELGRYLGKPGVTLAASELQRIDAAGLQLLAAFVQAASGRGTRVAWQAPTAVLRDAARRTGLTTALRLN